MYADTAMLLWQQVKVLSLPETTKEKSTFRAKVKLPLLAKAKRPFVKDY